MTEPLHITAAMAKLAQLRDTFHLPHPIGVRFTEDIAIAVVDVATFGEVTVWADALGVSELARLSTLHINRSSTHSAWLDWNGWHLRVVAHVGAPVVRAVEPMPSRVGCPNGCDAEFADTDCTVHGVVAMVKAVRS